MKREVAAKSVVQGRNQVIFAEYVRQRITAAQSGERVNAFFMVSKRNDRKRVKTPPKQKTNGGNKLNGNTGKNQNTSQGV